MNASTPTVDTAGTRPTPAGRRARRTAARLAAATAALGLCAASALPAGSLAAARGRSALVPACSSAGLVTWLDTQGNGAAGTIYYTLNFTNLSGARCTLRGYPGVSAVDLRGRQLGNAASRNRIGRVRTVMLGPGGTAHAVLGIVEAGNYSNCHFAAAAGLRVFAPNQTRSQHVPFPFQACSNRGPQILRIGPVS
ncbi:MAG TPA: DUF4232 domain-containing protein [Solirubrobacteraceae bacterium]|nr:DUF4232 domain-containing protein [Solirubrobacteraceae bacterium]